MTSAAAARRHDWLELIQISGPFVTVPIADATWPSGLPAVRSDHRARVRAALAELLDSGGITRPDVARLVLADVLGWGDALQEGPELPASLIEVVAENGATIRPDFAFYAEPEDDPEFTEPEDDEPVDEDEDDAEPATGTAPVAADLDNPWRLLGMWIPWGTHPLARTVHSGWAASPVERLAALLRARNVPIGVVSDGRWWAVVWAPRGKPVGAAVWDASLWSEELETLAGFVALLERRRFLGVPPEEQLPALLARSADAQEEVTTALGSQVRTSVEMLVRRFDELDQAADRELLRGVSDDDLYAGVVTVMMRIVFLLFAEERRVLPSDDDRYDRGYSVGRLVDQLRQRASLQGEQTLEHRTGAWHRLLAVARALHYGVHHEDLRLPAYGGGLFDPDRYPWLEGRNAQTPAVDDLTVLEMLEAVQYVRLRGERRRLSFRTLDVEQIGYVYEGLLELEVRTATEPILFLKRIKGGVDIIPASIAVEIDDLHTWAASTYLGKKKATPPTIKRADKILAEVTPPTVSIGLRSALEQNFAERLMAFTPLLRLDERDRPIITAAGGRYVAASTRRASTGAHYTPRSLAEDVVQHTLEPLVYRPGPLETLDRAIWVLRPSSEILALRVADIAMGSGAFLVATCRFLADRLVEAWHGEGDLDATRSLEQRVDATADAEVDEVLLRARRLVAEHCLYGVDINPLAVEMAKLSLWLVTMDRQRPFGFLDDRFVAGDSLLGIASLDQLETLHLDPVAGRKLREGSLDFGAEWRGLLARSADVRRRITATPVNTTRDIEHKMRLLREAQQAAAPLQLVADALTGAGILAAGQPDKYEQAVFVELESGVWSGQTIGLQILERYAAAIQNGLPSGKEARRPLHWPLVFPEVYADTHDPGFDAIIGNPPFLGGTKISGTLGRDYLSWLMAWDGRRIKGRTADLAARFLLRAQVLLGSNGQLGYVATNTLTEGDTLHVGLEQLGKRGWAIRRARSSHSWPSKSASISVVELWLSRQSMRSRPVLDDEVVPKLGLDLQPYLNESGRPISLVENVDLAFNGTKVLGSGFILDLELAESFLQRNTRNAEVLAQFVSGADLNRRPDSSASRWIVDFHNWSLDRAFEYRDILEHVRVHVKPGRDKLPDSNSKVRDSWWLHERRALGLSVASEHLEYLLALCIVGNVLLPVRVPTGPVFSHACCLFAWDDFASLAMLSSSAHQIWAIRYTSTLETRIRYAPSDVFLTWARPEPTRKLEELGEQLDSERREVMLGRSLGLTKLYNQVHNPAVVDPAIVRLREIHSDIDHAMLEAYGWLDLDLQIGHHPTKIGVRWTVSREARFELLDRLLIENHRRAAEQGS